MLDEAGMRFPSGGTYADAATFVKLAGVTVGKPGPVSFQTYFSKRGLMVRSHIECHQGPNRFLMVKRCNDRLSSWSRVRNPKEGPNGGSDRKDKVLGAGNVKWEAIQARRERSGLGNCA